MNINNEKHDIHKIIITILLIGIMIIFVNHFDIITRFFKNIFKLSYPFIIGLIIAYLLTPITNKLIGKMGKSKLKNKSYKRLNTVAIVIVETVFITLVTVIIGVIVIGIVNSGYNIVLKLPSAYEQFKDMLDSLINKHDILKSFVGNTSREIIDNSIEYISGIITDNFEDIANKLVENTRSIVELVIDIIFGIIISIFALANRAQFKRQSLKILKAIASEKVYNKTIEIFEVANRKFSGFFIGKIIDSTIIGIICLVGMAIMKMPYIALISIIIFITNIIPIIGPIIGAIPGIIIIFSESPIKAIYFTIFIIILQQIDGHIIGPKCIGTATGLNTFYVLFALIISGGLWGIAGMVIGVPLFSLLYYIIDNIVTYRIKNKHNKNNL